MHRGPQHLRGRGVLQRFVACFGDEVVADTGPDAASAPAALVEVGAAGPDVGERAGEAAAALDGGGLQSGPAGINHIHHIRDSNGRLRNVRSQHNLQLSLRRTVERLHLVLPRHHGVHLHDLELALGQVLHEVVRTHGDDVPPGQEHEDRAVPRLVVLPDVHNDRLDEVNRNVALVKLCHYLSCLCRIFSADLQVQAVLRDPVRLPLLLLRRP
mmetsp:Transcript_16088/g.40931  ORF Transcript_16088/g.40931 Transcript_16088/m.40931 type:complete len:213 (-) Transcript_16088:2-640(-)